MIDEVLQKFIEFVQNASPYIWQTLIKQVYVEAFGYLLFGVGLTAVSVILFKVGEKAYIKAQNERFYDGELLYFLSFAFSGVAGFVAFLFLVSAVKWFVNPDFYAIRFILESIQ